MFSLSDWFHEIIQEFTTMASIRRKCLNSPDSFCYICGSFTVPSQRMNISEFVKRAYLAYFKLKVGDQDKSWAPHNVCKPCVENLRQWTKGRRKQLSFGIPMVWREQKSHVDDCYFCLTKTSGYSKKTRQKLSYPYLDSAIRPVPHSHEIPVPVFTELPSLEDESDTCESDGSHGHESDTDFVDTSTKERGNFNQAELNDLVRDLGLSKELSELLASRLKEKNMLHKETNVTFYRNREKSLLAFFKTDKDFVYCCDVAGLLKAMGVPQYDPNEWRLFMIVRRRV